MDRKLVNGIEKFAGRYKHYKMWDTAIRLYNTIDEKEPERPSIQRKLAYCYGKTGRPEKEEYYIERAFEIDLERLEERHVSISANLSIAQTYQQIGNLKKEKYHLDQALDIALERVKNRPGSASSAYWLGKAYEQRGDTRSAFMHYEKAFNIKPLKKYRKAYMRTGSLTKE